MEYNDAGIPNLEKFPGADVEQSGERMVPPEEDFAKSFESGVPEFAGDRASEFVENGAMEVPADKYGTANAENMYYGEAKDDGMDADDEYNEGVADAAALINYGLNTAAQELGVEAVVQKLKGFDASGSEDPIGDFYEYLGLENPGRKGSAEGAFKAIGDMKELISEVEGADPRYAELRAGARAAGKGYFDYAVMNFGAQGFTELFGVLAEQRERAA